MWSKTLLNRVKLHWFKKTIILLQNYILLPGVSKDPKDNPSSGPWNRPPPLPPYVRFSNGCISAKYCPIIINHTK